MEWTSADIDFLRVNYGHAGDREIADALGRSIPAIRTKAQLLGFQKPQRKTQHDDPDADAQTYCTLHLCPGVNCTPGQCPRCGWHPPTAAARVRAIRAGGMTRNEKGRYRLVVPRKLPEN